MCGACGWRPRKERRDEIRDSLDELPEPLQPDDEEIATDGGPSQAPAPDDGDLSRFQLEILYVLAVKQGQSDYGLGLKRSLEGYYDEDINHGRLYPNLDTLVERGLVEKSELDKRTNEYALAADGKELLRRDAQRRYNVVDGVGGGR